MKIRAKFLSLIIAVWGIALVYLPRGLAGSGGCPLGSCPACGACLPKTNSIHMHMEEQVDIA